MTDKIILWITGPDIHFCLSYFLQNQHDCELYAVIDVTNRPKKFFKEQDLVKFKKIWFYHDHINKNHGKPDVSYLANFEKKYSIDLWKLAINERIFYYFNQFYRFTDEEILSILEQECKLFENIIEEINPIFFMTPITALHHNHLFYEICKKKGIKILMLSQTAIGYKCIISSQPAKIDFNGKLESIPSSNRTFADLQNFVTSNDFSKQVKSYQKRHASSKSDLIKAGIEFLFISNNQNVKTHYTYFGRSKLRVLLSTITLMFKKKYRKNFIDKHFLNHIIKNEKFIYYPMNMDQERATLLGTPFYTNQIEIIRNIAKSLPIDYKLYVKEHPAQKSREWRKISVYKEIMNIPNVRLIHPNASLNEIYNNCNLVIALGGPPGFEASVYGKPAIIFSDTDYSILPSVTRVHNIEDLSKHIRNSLSIKVNEIDVDKFINLLEKYLIDFDWFNFQLDELDHFFFGGNLIDLEISKPQMKSFIEIHKDMIIKLLQEHLKKINHIKELAKN